MALTVSGNALGSANDAFANRSDLGSATSAVIAYDSRDSTRQVGEPSHASNTSTGSLWWQWTAPANGQLWLKIAVGGADSSGIRAVYTGSTLSGLSKVAETSNSLFLPVPVTAGTTYQIAVADNRAAGLNLAFYPLPANDAFENRDNLGSAADFTIDAVTVGATLQSGEPGGSSQGPTLWWSWQAPADGIVTYDLTGSDGDDWNTAAYTGTTLGTLVKRSGRTSGQVADTPIALRVKSGETFAILVSRMTAGEVGRVRVNWHLAPQPYQATPTDAVDLGSVSSATGSADNRNAITPPDTVYAKLWWRWTAPANGVFRWTASRTDGSPIQPTTRTFDANLQQLSTHPVWQAYPCLAGQTYLLSADTGASAAGRFEYQLTFDPSATNDALANALPLAMGDSSFDPTYSGIEPGEPVISSFSWGRSLWWQWTALGDGALWLDVDHGSLTLGVWGLDPVVPAIKAYDGSRQLMATAAAGAVQRIGILESDITATSPGKLTAKFIPKTTGNDAFASAANLGAEWTVAGYGDPSGATREAGEPSPVSYGGSLWWKWTTPGSGNVRMRCRVLGTGDADSRSGLWLYRGAGLGSLVPVTGTAVTAGETLWVAVTGNSAGTATPIAFELMGAPTHPNDAFASATDLGGITTWQPSFFMDATSEPGEPIPLRSLWWKWTAPEAGNVFFSVPTANATCSVYQGSSLADLTLVADSTDEAGGRFVATAGSTYWLGVTGYIIDARINVDWRLTAPPPGDWFAAPVELGQSTSFALDTAEGSLMEPIEAGLFPAGYNQSLWWRWTAPANGKLARKASWGETWLLFEETSGAGAGLTPITDENVIAGHHYRIANINGPYKFTSPSTWLFHATPPNDLHPGAFDLGSVTAALSETDLYASTADATESSLLQSAPYPPSHGVWWQWTAPFDGVLKCRGEVTSNTLSYVSLAVLQGGNPSTWLAVGGTTSSSGGSAECLTTVKAGITYKILVGIKAYSANLAKLTLSAWPAPSNNDWANARDLGIAPSADTSGDNVGATREPFEYYYGSGSVWWKWTAPDARNVFVTARMGASATGLDVYQLSGGALVAVPGTSFRSTFNVGSTISFRSQPGRTYWIAVSGADPATVGKVDLALRTAGIPANDDFANRIVLAPGLPLVFSGNTAGSTVEAGEATYDSSNGLDRNLSLWWSWTAPASGPVSIEISGGNVIYVQTGNSIDALTTVKRASAGITGWTATAGVTYHFAVACSGHSGAPFQCGLSAFGISSNNNFAARTGLGSVTQGQWDTSTLLCSAETGEPAHGGQTATRSVWFEWTAPSSGGVVLEAVLSGFQARLGIYTGSAVGGLQNVAGGTWKVAFTTVAGQTYQIAVDGTEGIGSLTLQPLDQPANDLFANRTVLTGWPLPLKGSTMLAGKETGEPGTTSAAQRTLWWEWVAPTSDSYSILPATSTYASLAVYSSTGAASSFASLSLVTTVNGGSFSFSTTAGRYYYFKIHTTTNAPNGDVFDFRMDRSQGVPPAPQNDDFSNRIHLGDQAGVKTTGDLYGATRELWESGSSTQGTLWWSWTAPSDGVFCLRRSGPQAVTMTIYTGTNTASLVTVASGTGTREWFRAVAGTTYQIRCLSSTTTSSSSSSRLIGLEIVADAPPPNDAFATAIALPEPGATSIEGYNAGASAEASEPAHSGTATRASVWYQWTATIAGPIQISTTSATMRAGVYQGTALGSLTQIAAGNTPLTFTAVLGEIYRIALDSAGDETFFIRLTQPAPTISNDAFSAAIPLSGATVEVSGSTVGATLETGEPYHTGSSSQGGSAWWLWTAPADGAVEVSATGSSLPHFAIYQGSALDSLELVASGSGSCRFLASSGTTYRLAASATSSTGTTFILKLQQTGNSPSNDAFAQAQSLPPQALVTGTVDGASRETGESWHGSSITRQTVWYRWTAPANGRARVTLRSGSPGSLVVYRGITLTGLSPVVTSTTDAGFTVAAGDEIRILVGLGSSGTSGAFELEFGMTDTGGNDSFADRIDLGSAAQVGWTGTVEGATIEAGETPPEFAGNGTRWWTWTAPADGGVSLRLGSGRILPVAYVYTGTQLDSLSLLASSKNGSGLAFSAHAGTTYQIALRGKPSSTGIGDFLADLSLQALPNDNQAAATILDGVLPVSGSALLAGATSEPGENATHGSVWWRWVSPFSGQVDLDTSASDVSPNNTGVWTGPGLPTLQSVPVTYQPYPIQRFTATAGTTYWISLSSSQSTVFGTVRLQLRQASVPPNDLFANALPLAGGNIAIDTLSHNATTEAGEPIPRSRPYTNVYSRSLWWKWVAPRSGLLRVNISSGWTFLYEGASWQELREVAGPGGATSTTNAYWVEAGREYQVSAGNSSGGSVIATLALSPPGDRFDDALQISGSWLKQIGSLANCFWETGEPLHVGSAPQATLWLRWRAPSSGNFRVIAKSANTTLRTAAYTGNAISTLTERGSGKGGFVFTAVAGQDYHIAVDGGSPAGDFELVLAEEIPAYEVWRDSHFDTMDPASSPVEDPDHDGLVNLLEASLGSDPLAFTAGPAFTVDAVQEKIRLNLRRQSGGSGWRHSFDLSASLGGWQSTTEMNRSETIEDHGDGTETLHIVLNDYLISDHPALFFRLCAEGLPPN